VHDNYVVLNEEEDQPPAPWVNEPWEGIVTRVNGPNEEDHGVDEEEYGRVYVQEPQSFLVVRPYVL
jgi:hypothetical protein